MYMGRHTFWRHASPPLAPFVGASPPGYHRYNFKLFVQQKPVHFEFVFKFVFVETNQLFGINPNVIWFFQRIPTDGFVLADKSTIGFPESLQNTEALKRWLSNNNSTNLYVSRPSSLGVTTSTQSNLFPKLICFFYVETHKVSTSIPPGGFHILLHKTFLEQVHSARL